MPEPEGITRREQLRGLVPAELVEIDAELTVGWVGASRLVMARQRLAPHLHEAGYRLVGEQRDGLVYARDVRTTRGLLVRLLAGPAGGALGGGPVRATIELRVEATSDRVRVVGQATRTLADALAGVL